MKTQAENMMMEAKVAVMLLQTKESHWITGDTKAKRKARNGFSRAGERLQSCKHTDIRLLAFKSMKEYISVVLSHLNRHTLYGSYWKPIHLLKQ